MSRMSADAFDAGSLDRFSSAVIRVYLRHQRSCLCLHSFGFADIVGSSSLGNQFGCLNDSDLQLSPEFAIVTPSKHRSTSWQK
jgi:hypothetical protein